MPDPSPVAVIDVRFEHHRPGEARGIDETEPRLSWRFANAPPGFHQEEYEIQLSRTTLADGTTTELCSARVESPESQLVPWPLKSNGTVVIGSRETISARVRARPKGGASAWTAWSEPSWFETGLLSRDDWAAASLVSAPWAAEDPKTPKPEDLFRKTFDLASGEQAGAAAAVKSARLHITSQGVYEAEINGRRVGDYVLAPGWTVYYSELAYQTYDVTEHLRAGANCIGVRVAEGWFNGRLGWDEGGIRNTYGNRTALLAQLEVTMSNGSTVTVATDKTWVAARGPVRLAEIYDGEKYDATAEIPGWSSVGDVKPDEWTPVDVLPPLPTSVNLRRGSSEPVRRVQTIKPVAKITTPSGKTVLDFGQNLVGFLRLRGLRGPRGHSILLSHAEVLEHGELGTRPLRLAKAQDKYTLRGGGDEAYEPRFTFHGFRYAQVDGWPAESGDLEASVEAVVCHTDMEARGSFECSDERLNRLFENVRWSLRGNFLSIPTDCPQRNERLGWTGDLAVFAPTANFLYGSFGLLRDWLAGLRADQRNLKGLPPLVSPDIWWNGGASFGGLFPCAVWHDVVVLAPWAMWEATGDIRILEEQYPSIQDWLKIIPRDKNLTHLWDLNSRQLGDWLDPDAPPEEPAKAKTNAVLVANTFLINSLDHARRIATLLGRDADADAYRTEAQSARAEFAAHYYVAADGRMTSDAQTAYALAICFDLLPETEEARLAARLAELVRGNNFRVGTGFAGTPYVCEALARQRPQQPQGKQGHADVALSMLLADKNPSWLYPVSMGATTVWERWDSMLPDGSINPGEMTSFNHYAYGAVVAFMVARLAGLRRLEPGWRRARAEPALLFGGPGAVRWARAEHLTPYGKVACAWRLEDAGPETGAEQMLFVDVVVPPTTEMEVALPRGGSGETSVELVKSGEWSFKVPFKPQHDWPPTGASP